MDIIGIDIGTVSVKYVRVQKKSKAIGIVSQNCFDYKGTLEDLEDIIDKIASDEGTNHELVVGLTLQEIFKKSFTIPILPKEEIKEAVRWSVSKAISIPIEDTYYEFEVVGDIEERGIKKKDIFLAGIEKEYANRIIGLFKDKGFKNIALLTDTSFVYAPYIKSLSTELSVVVDIGGRITGIYIVENGKNMFFREILTASESFTDALMAGFNFSYGEAEDYKKEKGFIEDYDPILSTTLERLVGEMQRTFNVFAQKYQDRVIKKIYLTGRGSKIPNLIKKLNSSLTEEISFLPGLEIIEDIYLPAYLLCVNRSQLFNLLPEEMKSQKKEESQKKWIRIGTVGILAFLVVLTINMLGRLKRINSEIEINNMLILKKKQEIIQLSRSVSTGPFEEYASLYPEIKKKDLTSLSFLKYLSSKTPADISLKEVHLEVLDTSFDAQKKEQVKNYKEEQKGIQKKEQKSSLEGGYTVRIKGYVFGEKNLLETTLLEFIIKLEETGFIYGLDISGKSIKNIKGINVMEFELKGRCAIHEV